MPTQSSRLSRRSFVEHSALAAGLLGATGLAQTKSYGADAAQASVLAATSRVNARQHGATGDGKTDDTKALQAALNAAATEGPICYVPAGHYRLDGSLTVPAGVTLCGASGGVPHSEHPIGTVLLAIGGRGQADGEPLIALKPNAVDITLTNPYQAIDVGSKWNELHLVRDVFACPLKIGIYIDQCTDIGRIENVHFNPNFWTRMSLAPRFPGGDIQAYLEKNLVGFKIGKTDWEFISNSFVIFPKIGFHFDDFGHGPGNAVITQSGSDICPVAVRVDRSQPHAGVEFANAQFMGTLEVGPQNQGPVKLANCGFWGTAASREHVRHSGPSSLLLTACHFSGWDHAGKGDPCIRAADGRLVVNGCEFMDQGKHAITLEKGLKAATILGCLFRGPQAIADQSGADVQIGLNTSH